MINIAVMEGWAGGPRLSRTFREALRAAGYGVTDTAHADAIIAHSGACYFVPSKSQAKLLIMIDPPYWPGKHVIARIIAKKHEDNRLTRQALGWKGWLSKTLWMGFYIVAKPKYTLTSIKQNGSLEFLKNYRQKSIYVARNDYDYLCSPDIQLAMGGYPNIRYVTLPGGHDDYYTNPQPYIALIPKDL